MPKRKLHSLVHPFALLTVGAVFRLAAVSFSFLMMQCGICCAHSS
jgi:hypothetical protein